VSETDGGTSDTFNDDYDADRPGSGDDTADGGDAGGDADDNVGNRVDGSVAHTVLDYVAKAIVDDPDSVDIEVDEDRRGVTLRLTVAPDDMGKVIGRRGRVAQAIRTVVRAAGAAEDLNASVDIVD
jgi:predicted RNA-binding protein YlqC (UPF0109 family)